MRGLRRHRLIGDADLDDLVAARVEGELADRRALHRLVDPLQRLHGVLHLGRIGDAHVDCAANHAEVGEVDVLIAQAAANVIDQVVQPQRLQRTGVDLELQVGAALQVQAQIDALVRHP